MSTPRIVIAGAGLAGLTLGRCLLSKDIHTLILEKAPSSSRRHGYSIDLYSWAYRPLLDVLGTEEATFMDMLSSSPCVSKADASMAQSLQSSGERSPNRFRCYRASLEALLRQGLEIKWGHAISGISLGPQHTTVDIENKLSIQAARLIAADGIHSTVRNALVPDAGPRVHRYAVFYGIRSMPKETYDKTIAPQMQNETCIDFRDDDVLLRIFINNSSSATIDLGYTYSRPARLGVSSDPLYKPNRPIVGAKDIPEAFYTELGCLRDLEPGYAEVFDPAKVRQDRVLHWLMRSLLPSCSHVQALADVGVVMIGDAVHAMPILGSEGANMAIKDGVELAEWIAKWGVKNMGNFVGGAYQEWTGGVDQGVKRLEDMHGTKRAVL